MSEQKPEPVSSETNAAPASEAASGPVQSAPDVESPGIAPEQEDTAPEADAAKADPAKADAPKVEPTFEAKAEVKAEPPKVEAKKAEPPRIPGNVTIMSPGDRTGAGAKAEAAQGGKRRVSAMAAVAALALIAGAVGGALATAGIGQLSANDAASVRNVGLEASVARLDADILALKANVEQNAKLANGQLNRTSDRLDKVEKAQGEPAAKLAKLSDAVEKLRKEQAAQAAAAAAAPVAAAAPAAPKDVTGSIAPPATTPAHAPAATAKAEVGRLPTVEGWVLRDVGRGVALIESRRGIYEVYAGDPVPGLGRVDAIRKQDGRWVVVTSKGLIVAR
ncbi:hypothetical protein JQ628_06935 [Bradyrhizobium lablabi]|uniref:hypothetical protein n=1 Tax=Bradyrhizobium lablabi TaxID=722472 RepID=UPI001BADD6B8|nr:hypothetical protein [Bradyrhizobium lablabi]